MPVTLEDLIDATRRLADSNFATAAALNKMIPSFEQLRRDVYDIRTGAEMERAKLDLTIGRLTSDLAVLLKAVENAQTDVRDLQRDITGTHNVPPPPPPDNRSSAERFIEKFESLRTATKLWILALVLVIVSGFGVHLILAAFGVGG